MQVALRAVAVTIACAALIAACGSDTPGISSPASPPVTVATTQAPPTAGTGPTEAPPTVGAAQRGSDKLFPDVLEATATRAEDETWSFAVTMSSPYDSADRYANAWRVTAGNGRLARSWRCPVRPHTWHGCRFSRRPWRGSVPQVVRNCSYRFDQGSRVVNRRSVLGAGAADAVDRQRHRGLLRASSRYMRSGHSDTRRHLCLDTHADYQLNE